MSRRFHKPDILPLNFNRGQLRLVTASVKEAVINCPRGWGKSTVIAWIMHLIVENMPRSAWGIQGSTYMQILTRTLPSTVASLQRLGYVKDVHFFVGRQAPTALKWHMPYEPPLKHDHFIQFYNGTGFHLISQDGGGGASRGLNLDGVITDEALLIDKARFDQETGPTIRANLKRFSHVPFQHAQFHFTSMPAGTDGKWILEAADYYEKDGYDFVFLRNEICKLQMAMIDSSDPSYRLQIWKDLQSLEKECKFYTCRKGKRKGLLYIEGSAFDNISNLGLRYFVQQLERSVSIQTFMTENLGMRIEKITNGFYPYLDEKHLYTAYNNDFLTGLEYDPEKIKLIDSRADDDCVSSQPLWIAVDWGTKINCMSIGQKREEGFAFLKGMHVKNPQILDDLAKDFCAYYRHHVRKEAFFAYDHTGNTQWANSKLTFAEQFAKILKENGWTVHFMTEGAAPSHNEKYTLSSRILKEDNTNLPKIRINKHNCKYLLISLNNAPAKDGKSGIEKVKSSEKSDSIPQETATHYSDTFDLILGELYSHILYEDIPFMDIVRN